MAYRPGVGYLVPVLARRKDAARVGAWPQAPTLFIPVTTGTLPYLYGITQLVLDHSFWTGSATEVDQALNTLSEQLSEVPLTREEICGGEPPPEPYGATFRTTDGATLEAMQGEDLPPPPWEFRLVGQGLQFRSAT